MAIIPKNNYPTKIDTTDAKYPQGKAQNVSAPGDGTGTPWEQAILNDIFGFQQKLVTEAVIVPSGNPDNTTLSDYFDALDKVFGRSIEYRDTGAANTIELAPAIGASPIGYTDGLTVQFFLLNTLTGAATIEVGALGAKAFTLRGGTAFAGNELFTDEHVVAIYNLAAGRFELASEISDIGTVETWPLAAAPAWGLLCDGTAKSRATFANLFALIGTTYGVGDGATTFNLPDYQGEHLRGTDNGAGNDPDAAARTDRGDGTTGDAVGTKQLDAFQGWQLGAVEDNTGARDYWGQTAVRDQSANAGASAGRTYSIYGTGFQGDSQMLKAVNDGTNGAPRTTSETRGRNVGVNFVIRHRRS